MHTPARLTSRTRSPLLRRALGPALAAALAAGTAIFAPAPAAAQTPGGKIAVIDVRRAVLETEQGLRVQATLKKLLESRQVEIETKGRQLQTEKEAFEKKAQAGKTDKAVLAKEYEKLVQADADFQRAQLEMQRELQRKEQELTAPIYQGVLEAVKRIAAQDGFEMVLEKSAVPYFRGDLEITDRAIQMYNGGNPGKGPAPAPAPGKPAAPAPAPAKPAAPPTKK
jgi:outer membrane protein